MSRRKQSNPKPLLKNESENQVRDMAILQQDRADISSENDDEPNTVSSDDSNITMQPQSINEIDKTELPLTVSPVSLEMNSNSHSPVTSNTPIASPALLIDMKNERHTDSELPKLRLNITLASDPALQPEAKDIQSIRANTVENYDTESNCDDEMRAESTSPVLLHDDEPPPQKRRRNESSSFRSAANNTFTVNLASNVGATVNPNADILPRVPAFVCAPCGIKFSSMSTLEAHKTFYCSHSKKDTDDTNNPLKVILVDDGGNGDSAQAKNIRTGKQYGCNQCSYSADKKVSLNRHMRMHQTSPTSSSVTSNGDDGSSQVQHMPQQQPSIQIHQIDRYCTDCDIRFSSTKTYRAHKQHYCSGRHRDGSGPSIPTAKPSTPKTAYPKTSEDSLKAPETIGSSQLFLALPTKPIIIVPYSMISGASVLPARTISPSIQNPDMNCFILQNGSLQPIAQAISLASTSESTSPRAQTPVAKTSSQSNDSDAAQNHVEISKPTKRKEAHNREGNTTPLDLSVRRLSMDRAYRDRSASISSSVSGDVHRTSVDASNDGKENVLLNSSNSASPEQIVCAPSLPGSPPLTPSPKRRSSCSPRGILTISPSSSISSSLHLNQSNAQVSTILRPLLANELTARITDSNAVAAVLNAHATASQHLIDELTSNMSANHNVSLPISKTASPIAASNNATKKPSLSASMPLNQPQIFVKQGVSKCKECNIVFCKYENYLAHKKHYCSSRNIDEAADGKTKPSPPTSPLANNVGGNTSGSAHGAYQQLICAACGIKFTSLDNLQAHQMYYCPKRIEVPATVKDKCTKCKTVHEASHACPANQNLYKCPICDVVSANSTESRKHIESHAGVRGYRCSICRYKGNTIRGMRTHIRMHFDKKTSDFNEENYISCEIEEDNGDIIQTSTASVVTALASNAQNAQKENSQSSPPPIHCCDKCGYSSTHKINLIQHANIAHPASDDTMPSVIGAAGESLLWNKAEIDRNNKAKIIIKTEQQEVKGQPSPKDFEEKIDSLPDIIKTEHIDISDNDDDDDKHSDIVTEPVYSKPYQNLDSEAVKKSILGDASSISMNALNPPVVGAEKRFCHVCGIKFNYPNTFIAHKKFYCKGLQNDIDTASATTNQPTAVITTARSSPNQTSVVT